MSSTSIFDWLGRGLAADRPADPGVGTGTAIWYATDTGISSIWDGSGWAILSGGSLPTILQSAFNGGASISGVTFGGAPANGTILIAIVGGTSPSPASGWNLIDPLDAGGFTVTRALWKLCGGGESATQNPIASAANCVIGIYNLTGDPFSSPAALSNAGATSITQSISAPRTAGLIIGAAISDNSVVLPSSFTGATADATALGSSKSIAGFHISPPVVGANSVTANYPSSVGLRIMLLNIS